MIIGLLSKGILSEKSEVIVNTVIELPLNIELEVGELLLNFQLEKQINVLLEVEELNTMIEIIDRELVLSIDREIDIEVGGGAFN
jgi:hypothetical protein